MIFQAGHLRAMAAGGSSVLPLLLASSCLLFVGSDGGNGGDSSAAAAAAAITRLGPNFHLEPPTVFVFSNDTGNNYNSAFLPSVSVMIYCMQTIVFTKILHALLIAIYRH